MSQTATIITISLKRIKPFEIGREDNIAEQHDGLRAAEVGHAGIPQNTVQSRL